MPCQQPNPIENYPFIKRWATQLEKHSSLFTYKSLLFTTILFILAGYAIVGYLQGRPDIPMGKAVPVIQMGNACLIFITLYFSVIEYLFRKRPPEIRLIQRFVWYLALLFIAFATGLGCLVVAM